MINTFQFSFAADDIKKLLEVPKSEGIVVSLELKPGTKKGEAIFAISAAPILKQEIDPKTKKAKTLSASSTQTISVAGCPHPPGCN